MNGCWSIVMKSKVAGAALKTFLCGLLIIVAAASGMAQGTPGTLRCASRVVLDVHDTREPSSPVVARLQCGDPVLVIDMRFGSAHVRTKNGSDGYIIDLNFGQWSIVPEVAKSKPPSTGSPVHSVVTTDPAKATVWLYRPNSDRSNVSPITYLQEGISSRRLARLDKGQFFGIQLSAGEHAFSWTNTPARGEQLVITLEPGQEAYLEVEFHSIARVDSVVVDSRRLKPVDSNNVFDLAVIAPAQGLPIPGTAALNQSVAPVAKRASAAVPTLSSPAAPPSPAEPTTFISDETKLRGKQIPSEDSEEGLNSPRLFEAYLSPSSLFRWNQMNLFGGELELAVKLTHNLSFIANVGDHRSIGNDVTVGSGVSTSGHVETLTYRFGPKFSIRPNDRLTIFGHAAAGRAHVKAIYDFGHGFVVDALGNGLVISGGGGVDFAIKKWLGIRLVQSEYTHTRIEDVTWRGLLIGSGLVLRIK